MMINNHINYIEFKAPDLTIIKSFYSEVFNWAFTDYGPTYTSFENSGLVGGFELASPPIQNGALAVLYHEDLDAIQKKIIDANGKIVQPTFSFPGGKRFHFKDPAGNELAVWSEN